MINDELKIFLTFLLIFVLFAHWVGWNETSRLDLTRSTVNQNSLNIDEYANNTGDRAFYNKHYYTDKAPGSSLLNTGPYWFIKSICGKEEIDKQVYKKQPQFNTTIYEPIKTSFRWSLFRLSSIVFISSLLGSLLIVLIYKTSMFFVNRKNSLLIAFIFGLGTLIFYYSTVFMGIITATFFVFLSFYFVLKDEFQGINEKYYYLIGVLGGFSIVIEYFTAIITFLIIIYIFLKRDKEKIKKLLLGIFIGLLPLLIYNSMIFHDPFEITTSHADSDIFRLSKCENNPELSFCTMLNRAVLNPYEKLVYVLPRITFYPSRGLFFYSPILIFSILGLYFMGNSKLKIFIAGVVVLFFLFNTSYFYWFGGSSFGPRYLVPMIPFLSIPLSVCLKKYRNKKIIIFVLIFLISVSIFHNFLGFNNWEGIPILSNENYFKTLKSSRILSNPLYTDLFKGFLDHGPRSQILSGLRTDSFELSYSNSYPENIMLFILPSIGFLTLKIPFLSLFLVWLIIMFFWWRNIRNFFDKIKPGLFYFVISLILIISFIFLFSIEKTYYHENWYPKQKNSTKRWMSQDATILLFSKHNRRMNLNITIDSYLKSKHLDLYLNNKLIGNYYVDMSNETILVPEVKMKKGLNRIKFHSEEGCEIPRKNENSTDVRCLSFGVKDFKEISFDKLLEPGKLYYYKNWYEKEKDNNKTYRWSSKNPGLLYKTGKNKKIKLNLTLKSCNASRKINLYINNRFVKNYTVHNNPIQFLTPTFKLNKGLNRFRFKIKCARSSKSGTYNDSRCLGLQLFNLDIINHEDLLEKNKTTFYSYNVYNEEKINNRTFRWVGDKASIYFLSNTTYIRPELKVKSYNKERKMILKSDAKKILDKIIGTRFIKLNLPIVIPNNDFLVDIISKNGCEKPCSLTETNDCRCLSFALNKVGVKKENNLLKIINSTKRDNWYYLEGSNEKPFRWMSQNATLKLFNTGKEKTNLKVTILSYHKPRTIKIFNNGQFTKKEKIRKNKTISIGLQEGINKLKFYSGEGCDRPSKIENTSDNRCLSFRFENTVID